MVWSEVEPLADVILVYYPGGVNFNGAWFYDEVLLNMQQPASMETIEARNEDVPRNMECYVDDGGKQTKNQDRSGPDRALF